MPMGAHKGMLPTQLGNNKSLSLRYIALVPPGATLPRATSAVWDLTLELRNVLTPPV